jgi:hypothetical protein
MCNYITLASGERQLVLQLTLQTWTHENLLHEKITKNIRNHSTKLNNYNRFQTFI